MHASKALQDIRVIEDIWMTGLLDTVIRAFELGRRCSQSIRYSFKMQQVVQWRGWLGWDSRL